MLTHSLQSIANGNIIFIPKGAEWSYSDNGINLGKDWKEPDFDDSAWKKGETVIGFGNNNITTIAERGGVDARNITFYFRKEFNFSSKLNDSFSKIGKELSLRLGILRDDGAVIYLNGEEIARDNMPEGEINSTTLASSSVVGTGESTYHEKNINPKFELKLGKNVIAVEVHQITSGSGDLGFDLHLDGIINEKINGFTIESLESRHKGSAIDSNNRFLIIGAPQSPMNDFTVNFTDGSSYDTWELGTGEVQIYKKLNSIWVKHSTITSSNADRNDFFGYSVAIHNDTIVVGAPYEDGNLNEPGNSMNWQDSGAAYVFKLVNNTWVQTAYLKADNSGKNDHFGFSVDISNDQIIIGAPFEDSSINNPIDDSSYDSGAAYIFSLKDNNWTQDSFLKSFNSDANDNFGYSVSISNRLAIIGAPREDGDGKSSSNNSNQDSGAVYIFERNNNIPEPIIISEISPKKTLVPTSDLGLSWTNRDYDDSNWIEVLNTNEEGNSGGIGFAWSNIDRDDVFDPFIANDLEEQMYRKNQTAYLRIPFNIKEKKTYQNLDLNVRTDDGFIAYINGKLVQSFKAPEKPNWESGATSANPDSIAIQLINFDLDAHVNKLLDGDNVLAIHAMNFGINGSDFLFSCELKSDFSNSKWLRKAYLKASNPDPNDMFGRSIATDGSTLVVGAPLEDSDGTNEKNNSSTDSGAVYVFEFLGFQWEQTQYIKSTIVQELSLFGNHLDLSGNYIAISEPNRISVNSEILFGTNHPKKILLPNQDIGLEWTSNINYDDSQWISSIGGIGFERETDRLSKRSYLGLYDLDLSRAMFDNFNPLTTVYVRIPFLIKDKTDISSLMMFMQSDDGYIVYLNGVEIHRFNAPTNPNWRSASTTWHADEEVTDGKIISLDQHIDKLLQGENLLAIHAMNSDGTNSNTGVSSDFLMNCLLSTNLKPRDRGQISIYSNQNFEWKINKIFNSNSEKGILLGSGIAMNRNELVASTPREPGIESIANNISALIYENQEGSWNEIDSLGDGINSTISLSSFSGKSYSIQVSHDFDEWIDIESNIKGTGFEIIKNYTLPGNSQFFRITEKTDPIIKE
tara:strand:+ start:785 stop:4033 length:3249 start_codon:yes stop_codon:yes gene_type:complete